MLTQFCEQLDLAAGVLLSCQSSDFKQAVLQQALSFARSSCALLFPAWRSGRPSLERALLPLFASEAAGLFVLRGERRAAGPAPQTLLRSHPGCLGRVASSSGTGLKAPRDTFPVPPNRIGEQGCACGISRKTQCQVGKERRVFPETPGK